MQDNIYYGIVEDAIRRFNLNPAECVGEAPGVWYLGKGPALARVFVWTDPQNQMPYVRVACPILALEEGYQNFDLAAHFLQLNAYYIGVKFVKSEREILLGVDREMPGLDANEMYAMILRVLNIGAEQIPLLKEQFASEGVKVKVFEANTAPQEA